MSEATARAAKSKAVRAIRRLESYLAGNLALAGCKKFDWWTCSGEHIEKLARRANEHLSAYQRDPYTEKRHAVALKRGLDRPAGERGGA